MGGTSFITSEGTVSRRWHSLYPSPVDSGSYLQPGGRGATPGFPENVTSPEGTISAVQYSVRGVPLRTRCTLSVFTKTRMCCFRCAASEPERIRISAGNSQLCCKSCGRRLRRSYFNDFRAIQLRSAVINNGIELENFYGNCPRKAVQPMILTGRFTAVLIRCNHLRVGLRFDLSLVSFNPPHIRQ